MFGIDITVLAFVGLVVLAAGTILLFFFFDEVESGRKQGQRVNRIKNDTASLEMRKNAQARVADASKRRQSVQNSLKELEEKTKSRDPNKVGIKDQMRQAGLTWTMKHFIIISLIAAVVFAVLVLLLGGGLLFIGAGFVIGGLGFPRWLVSHMKKRRMKAFLTEFPNAVDVIVRGIKAGLPLNDCLGIVASESKEPVNSEFKRILETQQMGIPMTEAIQKLYKNVPLTEANFFGIVIAIQQSSGGNLSEALSNLSGVLRDRKKMQAKIKAMSSEAKASAGIIGSLPFIVTLLVYITTPDYISVLFTSDTGHLILLASGVWMAIGVMVMKSMINFDF